MSQPELELFTKRGIAMKLETTEGVDSSPGTSTDGILLFNGSMDTSYDKKERVRDLPYFTGNTYAIGNKAAFVEGDFELFAPATPGVTKPANHVLLVTAGMASVLDAGNKTTTYNPITDSIPSATAHWWHADIALAVTGARTNITSLKMEVGSIFTGKAHVQGSYDETTEDALPSITTYDDVPVTCTYDISEAYITSPEGGSELLVWAKSLEIIFNSKLASKEYTSVKRNRISDRKASWNMRIAKTDLTDFNPLTARDQALIITARMRMYETGVFGIRNGLYSEMGIRGQIDTVKEVNIDDDLGWDLSGTCVATSAGGDEFYLEFGDDTTTITTAYTGGTAGAVSVPQTFSGRALTGTQAWTVSVGALPSGVTLDPLTGEFGGTSVVGGPTTFTVQVTDSSEPVPQVVTKSFTLTYT